MPFVFGKGGMREAGRMAGAGLLAAIGGEAWRVVRA
jgi:hypothetical protein